MIFFDLDGPILDVSEKYYRVYSDILSQNGFKVLTKSEYWDAKRDKTPETTILQKSMAEAFIEKYRYERNLLIESDPYLIYDRLQDGARDVLENLSSKTDLILVTLRTHPEQLYKQLEYLNLKKYFRAVLTSGEEMIPRWQIKYDLIKKFLGRGMKTDHILIGDTETDILAGNNIGFKTVAILNGIRSFSILKNANPTYLINTIQQLLVIIEFKCFSHK